MAVDVINGGIDLLAELVTNEDILVHLTIRLGITVKQSQSLQT